MSALLSARPYWVATLAQLTGLTEAEVRKRLILVAALHDLGKFADNFQAKVPELYQHLNGGTQAFADHRGHGDIGAEVWDAYPLEHKPAELDAWLKAAFSHHGVPVSAPTQATCNALSPQSCADAWAFLRQMLQLIGAPEGEGTSKGVWLVSGLVILADWLGSNQAWFPYRGPDMSLEAYWRHTQNQAHRAVSAAALIEAQATTGFDIHALLGEGAQATPLQQWADSQAPKGSGHLYIIEDLTGSGKTEAALLLAHRLMASGAAEGLYWALPTMATANGLYARLKGRYRLLFAMDKDPAQAPSLILSHSAADINQDFQASITHGRSAPSADRIETEQEVTAEAYCADFFAQENKKAFLAQVGVGTLDQALLGILPVRHQSLRLAALARRVLVIDEAHSFDAYTGRLMERLLDFHARQGGSAIILSATLSQSQRANLVKAYSKKAAGAVTSDAFPLVTHVHEDILLEQTVASGRGSRRDLPVKTFNKVEPVLEALLERAAAGHCGVYIRNTVEDARAAYVALKAAASEGTRIDLFHARYTTGDRARIEANALANFGFESESSGRQGRILVATQVVESSLDLDFDVMATDLCPMDLLIQRAGRLQRHGHRPARPAPELWVLAPSLDQPVNASWYADLFPKGQFVYPDVGQLWRTLKVLKQAQGLNLKNNSPRTFIEPVFDETLLETPEALMTPSDQAVAKGIAGRGQADLNALKYKDFRPWDREARTPTRLGEDTRKVRLATWLDGTLTPWCDDPDPERAWRLSELSIETRKLASTLAPSAAATEALSAVQARWAGRYDPPLILVLEPDDIDGIWRGQGLDSQARPCRFLYDHSLGLSMV